MRNRRCVGLDVHSETIAVAVKSRSTRSGGRAAAASEVVVLKRRPRIAPCKPSSRISRSTVQPATPRPSRRSCRHTFRGPYTRKVSSHARRISCVNHASRTARAGSDRPAADARHHARPGVPNGAVSLTCSRSCRRPTESPPTASRAGARDRAPTGRLVPGPPVSISSVFPWTPSSQELEPPGNPGRFSLSADHPWDGHFHSDGIEPASLRSGYSRKKLVTLIV